MPDPIYITVTAPPDRHTPIHPDDGREPGGAPLIVTKDGGVRRVRYSQAVRRAIGRGDLIPCDLNGAPVAVTLANAPDDLSTVTTAPMPVADGKAKP